MAIIGYIKNPQSIKDASVYLEKMNTLGCHRIYEDDTSSCPHRLRWKYILENKNEGDTIIIYKLSNALGGWVELPIFLNLCVTNRIRLISLKDKFDSSGVLFNTSVEDFLNVLMSFGLETYKAKRHLPTDLTKESVYRIDRERQKHKKQKLKKDVLNDYYSGTPVEFIFANRGVSSNFLYRVLKEYGTGASRNIGVSYQQKNKKT